MDYYIDTPEDLTNILGACIRKNRTRGCRFVIRKDLDCGIITNFAPLGNGSRYSFDGELDGADHVIRNLEICPRQTYDLNVINLRKRTIPDVFTPIHGIKTSGIVLGVSLTI